MVNNLKKLSTPKINQKWKEPREINQILQEWPLLWF
jgi:hypothetical protein